jgi:hypothetical protein
LTFWHEDVRDRLPAGVANLEELVRTLPYSSLDKFREPDFMALSAGRSRSPEVSASVK